MNQGDVNGNRMDFEYFFGSKGNNFDGFVELGSLVDIKGGKRIPKGKTYSQNFVGYKYLRVDDLDENGLFVFDNLKNIDDEVFNSIKNYFIEKNNLCVSIAGTIGKIALIEEDFDKKLILTENCAKLIIKDENIIIPKYLKFILKSDISQNQFESNYGQATIAKLSLERLKQTKIYVPSLDIQKEIVEKMEQVFAEKQKLEAESKETLKNIDEYVLGELGIKLPEQQEEKMCFSVISSKLTTENLSVGYYSSNLDFGSTKFEYLEDVSEINPTRKVELDNINIVPYIGLPDTSDGNINIIDHRQIKEVQGRKITIEGDILFARIEPSIFNKKYIYVDNLMGEKFAYISTEFIILRSNGKINNKFLYYMLFRDFVYNQFAGKTTGSTGRRRLDNSVLKKIKIPFPSLEIQEKIAYHIEEQIIIAKMKQVKANEIYEKAKKEAVEMILE